MKNDDARYSALTIAMAALALAGCGEQVGGQLFGADEPEPFPEAQVSSAEVPDTCTFVEGDIEPARSSELERWRDEDCIWVEGSVLLSEVEGLTDLTALSGLRRVGGGLGVHRNPNLVSLEGLRGLEEVGAKLGITENPRLERIDGLGSLRTVGSGVALLSGAATVVEGFDALEQTPSLTIEGLQRMETFDAFGGLERVTNLRIAGLPLEELGGFGSLHDIEGSLTVTRNFELRAAPALRGLSDQSAVNVAIANNPKFPRCEAERIAKPLIGEETRVDIKKLDDQATCDP